MKQILLPVAALLSLSACSSDPQSPDPEASGTSAFAAESTAPQPVVSADPADAPMATPTGSAKVLGLEGLEGLRIGEALPEGGSWAMRGAQVPGGCRTVSSPEYPGVYAIVEEGKVRRITIGQRSDVKLVEGIGAGASESDVTQAFPGFRSEPHKYQDLPAKYLTAPNASSGDPALRFEIDRDRKVSLIHVGTMPVLGYVEGCS